MSDIDLKPLQRFSYSNLSTYSTCKFKWFTKYSEKNFIYNSTLPTEFGSLIHETEEAIAHAIVDKVPIDYVALKNKFIIESRKLAIKYPESFFARDKSDRTYQEKVYLYLDSGIYRLERYMKQHPELCIIGIEQKFEYDYDGAHSFNGSIDRAFKNVNTGEILIQDIKSWPVAAQNSELKAPMQFLMVFSEESTSTAKATLVRRNRRTRFSVICSMTSRISISDLAILQRKKVRSLPTLLAMHMST